MVMVMVMEDVLSKLGASLATLMFIWTLCQNYFPEHLGTYLISRCHKIYSFFNPYVHITFHEFEAEELFERSKVFLAIERYLGHVSTANASRFVAKPAKDSCRSVVLSMGNHQEVVDVFGGGAVKVWWNSVEITSKRQSITLYPREDEKRCFNLKFHRRDRETVTKSYLQHVLAEGEAIRVRERKLKLYTNNKSDEWRGWKSTKWSHVIFKHPSTFDTLAMDPTRKQEIVDELLNFRDSKEYYAKIGKAWKRGYLLHGPPGTGKSSMIAAMATLLQYDVYDLELTTVKDNNELRRLLIDTSDKSIIVIEDIDCSLDLTGQREKKEEDDEKEKKDPIKKELIDKEVLKKKKESEVTLSGLLNVIDGLWSAIGEERIVILTTNHIEKLDPALIRRGRMDSHIEMSYCCFEAFKVLAKNYLDIRDDDDDSESSPHPLFPEIRRLLGETKTTPADVAENMMPKSAREKADACLQRLVKALETAKEEARLKAEEEKRANAVKEEEEHRKKKEQEADDLKKAETTSVHENGDAKK